MLCTTTATITKIHQIPFLCLSGTEASYTAQNNVICEERLSLEEIQAEALFSIALERVVLTFLGILGCWESSVGSSDECIFDVHASAAQTKTNLCTGLDVSVTKETACLDGKESRLCTQVTNEVSSCFGCSSCTTDIANIQCCSIMDCQPDNLCIATTCFRDGSLRFTLEWTIDDSINLCVITPDKVCLLYTSPSPRDLSTSRMPSSA